ncbi:MAG: TetR/AcrR family transcriptional regulator [Spirochaetes bacterium]|nr:TetR/AcrR family transcriptional regulator [Spirochaetota bacterium]
MSGSNRIDSKTRILESAKAVFAQKGSHGATMDEIGAKAGVNKAMVYYYFNSKENLYYELLCHLFMTIGDDTIADFDQENNEGGDYNGILERLILLMFRMLNENTEKTTILIDAVVKEPEMVVRAMNRSRSTVNPALNVIDRIKEVVEKGKDAGVFRDIDTNSVCVSIIGMGAILHIMGLPLAQSFLQIPITDEKGFLQDREKSVLDLVLYGIVNGGAAIRGV